MEHNSSQVVVGRWLKMGEAPPLELTLFYGGRQDCPPGHSHYGVRDHYLLHFVFSGKGAFRFDDRTVTLGPGDGFVMFPNRPGYYRADATDPWSYGWAGFSGAQAAMHLGQGGISRRHPVFHLGASGRGADCCRELMMSWPEGPKDRRAGPRQEFHFRSLLYRLLHILAETSRTVRGGNEPEYVHAALRFIYRNHSRAVTIEEIARHVGIDRKYLSVLFKKATGMSSKAYLTQTRISAAAGLLRGTDLPVFAVAHSVGFPDELHFSRVFRQAFGKPPRQYRREGGEAGQ